MSVYIQTSTKMTDNMNNMNNKKPGLLASTLAVLAFIVPIVALFWGTYSVYLNDWETSFLMFSVFLLGAYIIGLATVLNDKIN